MEDLLNNFKNENSKLKGIDASLLQSTFKNITPEELKTIREIVKQTETILKDYGTQKALKYLETKKNELRNSNG